MAEELYAITGATGNIGSKVVAELVSKGKKVRAIGRNADKLKALTRADAFVESMDDVTAMTRAFTGAKAVFTMIPPNLAAPDIRTHYNKISEALAAALVQSKVKYVVNLSSIGAHQSNNVGPIIGLYDHEQRFNKLNEVNILHLRPTFFMENTLMNIGLIKQMGINGTPMNGDLPLSMIATQDIASEVVRHLLALDFAGKQVIELLGQRDVTMNEVTQILGKAIGKNDLKYTQFPYEDAQKAMVQMGLSSSMASSLVEMQRSFNEGLLRLTHPRTPQNTTPTSIEQFAKDFAKVYNNTRN